MKAVPAGRKRGGAHRQAQDGAASHSCAGRLRQAHKSWLNYEARTWWGVAWHGVAIGKSKEANQATRDRGCPTQNNNKTLCARLVLPEGGRLPAARSHCPGPPRMSHRKSSKHLLDHNAPPAGPPERPERSPSTTRLLRAAGATALAVLHCRAAPRMLLLLLNTAWGRKALRSCAIVAAALHSSSTNLQQAPPSKRATTECNARQMGHAARPAQAAAQHSMSARTDLAFDRAVALHGSLSAAMASITTPPGHPAQNIALICARLKDLKLAVQAPDSDLQVGSQWASQQCILEPTMQPALACSGLTLPGALSLAQEPVLVTEEGEKIQQSDAIARYGEHCPVGGSAGSGGKVRRMSPGFVPASGDLRASCA